MPPEIFKRLQEIPGGLEFMERAEEDYTEPGLRKLLADKIDEARRAAHRDEVLFSEAVGWLGIAADEIERRMLASPPEDYARILAHWHQQYRQRFPAFNQENPHLTGAAHEAMTYASRHVTKAAYDLLAKLPFRVEFAFPEHDAHLGVNSAGGHLGRVRILAGEEIACGGYSRGRGEPLGSKKAKEFSGLVPVGPGSPHWGALPSLDDVVAAARVSARMRKQQASPEVSVAI